MIQLHPVTNLDKLNFDLKQIYETSFPADERREWTQLLELLNYTQFSLNEIYDQQKFLGFISIWNLTEFSFIEHFAIRVDEQGKGYGTQAIKQVLSMNSKPVILEVEEPFTENARKRIAFYERLNFTVNNFSYFQPAYSAEKNCIRMLLLSHPTRIYPEDFERIKDRILDRVYGYKTKAVSY
jgi:ribosomal protein S18 acetylase RimI-like enzyme